MIDGSTIVAGIEIPSTDPVFLSIVAIHIPLGVICVVSGAVAMLSAKAPGRHPRFGTIYYWSVAAIFASATALSIMRWADNYHLFILGVLTFAAAHLGRTARRRRRAGWARWQRQPHRFPPESYLCPLTRVAAGRIPASS